MSYYDMGPPDPGGGGMPTLEQLLGNLGPSDEDRKRARAMGLLQFGLSLIGAPKGQELQAISRGGLLGVHGYNQDLLETGREKVQNQVARNAALQGLQHEQTYRDDQAQRAALAEYTKGRGVIGAPQVPMPGPVQTAGPVVPMGGGEAMGNAQPVAPVGAAGPGGIAPKVDRFKQYMELADFYQSKGLGKAAMDAQAIAEKYRPVLKETKTLMQGGKRVTVNIYQDGTQEVIPFAPDAEKAHFADTGQAIKPLDPFTGAVVGPEQRKQQTPDAMLGAEISMRGQNMVDSRSRDQNAISSGNQSITQIHTIRKELNSLQDVQSYRQALPMLKSAASAPNTRAGDLDVIYAVGKALDPGSVVREGELNLVIKSGNLPQQVVGAASYVMDGGKLPPEQRQELMSMLRNRVDKLRQAHDQAAAPFLVQAKQAGLPWDQIYMQPSPVDEAPAAASKGGLTPAEQQELERLRKQVRR